MGVSSCSSRSSVFLMADNHLTGFSVQQHSRHFRFWPGICLSKGNLSSPTLLLLPPTLLSLRDHFPFAQIERVVNKVRYRHDILTGMASNSFNSFPTVKSASHPCSLCNNCSQLLDSMTYSCSPPLKINLLSRLISCPQGEENYAVRHHQSWEGNKIITCRCELEISPRELQI